MCQVLMPAVGVRATSPFVKQLNALQDTRGTVHDALAAEQLLATPQMSHADAHTWNDVCTTKL
jgi:CHAD domain-containing protein